MSYKLHHGDCLDVMRTMPDNSVDSIVTDPPYGLRFMGRKWDYNVPSVEVWAECLRVLKPGGHLLSFGGSRTYHRMACAIEDAGFEIRDSIMWIYGSGFPKSLDVSKAIDKAAGLKREVVGSRVKAGIGGSQTFAQDAWTQANRGPVELEITAPSTDDARRWQGWGTALKPAHEPIVMARKPLAGTVAANVLAHGTGALNIDACRVAGCAPQVIQGGQRSSGGIMRATGGARGTLSQPHAAGRWPANIIHDGSAEVLAGFPRSKSGTQSAPIGTGGIWSGKSNHACGPQYGDGVSNARFFYCSKASRADRDEGCDDLHDRLFGMSSAAAAAAARGEIYDNGDGGMNRVTARKNTHPTVKPTDLMRYLCRLVTPPGGLVLDPFTGSGSTGRGALLGGFRFVGIEREAEYIAISDCRISHAAKQTVAA